jgi:hypothetical protein
VQTSELYADKAVIVRARGDMPVKLSFRRFDKDHCYVGHIGRISEIGVPSEQVFAFSDELYNKLIAAFQAQDLNRLRELYAQIPVDDLACNKYQNRL